LPLAQSIAEGRRPRINFYYMENHVAIGAKWAESPLGGLLLHDFECNKYYNQVNEGGGRR